MKTHSHFYHPLRAWDNPTRDFDWLLSPWLLPQTDVDASPDGTHWTPSVDIVEEAGRFVVYADIPGVDPENVEMTVEDNTLSIKGERESVKTDKAEDDSYKRVERFRGTFSRRFTLPDTADVDKISASGKNGVLEIVIPKKAAVQARRITVTH